MFYTYIISFSLSLIISIVLINFLIKISKKYNIYDQPNERKSHRRKISFLGGFAIFSSLLSYFDNAFGIHQSP